MKDVIIIGSGPAGISASLYTMRANMSTLVIGKSDSSLGLAQTIENYYGFESITGTELLEKGRRQCERLGGTIIEQEVTGLDYTDKFTVTAGDKTYEARAVILSTGASRTKAKINNLADFEGKGVSYCAVCDAFFHRGKEVAVLGSGIYALHEAMELVNIASGVTVLTNGADITADFPKDITVVTKKIDTLMGENKLESIVLEDGESLNVSGLFIALGSAGASEMARKIGVPLDENKISVDDKMQTALPGLFACGDCVKGIAQISVAVGQGCTAAMSAISFLRKKK